MWCRGTDTDSPKPLEGCCRFTIVGDTGQIEALLLMRYRQTDRLIWTTWRLQQVYHCWRHHLLKVAADLTIVGDTGQVRLSCSLRQLSLKVAVGFCGDTERQTDTETHLNHLKVAAGLPLLETQVRLRLSCSCGDRQTDRLTWTTWRLQQVYHCWRHRHTNRHRSDWGSPAHEVQTDRQTDSPEPLEGCSRFTIVGDTGQIEALLLMWYFHQGSVRVSVNHNVLGWNYKNEWELEEDFLTTLNNVAK